VRSGDNASLRGVSTVLCAGIAALNVDTKRHISGLTKQYGVMARLRVKRFTQPDEVDYNASVSGNVNGQREGYRRDGAVQRSRKVGCSGVAGMAAHRCITRL
jgi:hypothetical protein